MKKNVVNTSKVKLRVGDTVILDVKNFAENITFQIREKADVDFVTNLLKYSKYIDEPCDGIIDYAITYDDYTYDVLMNCSEIRKDNKQAKISDKDMEELERILVTAADKKRIYTYEESVEEMSKPYLSLDKENRKFQFFWSMFSSYIAQGTYEVKDNEIICKTDDGNNVYTFEILEGEGYKFIESKSSRIRYHDLRHTCASLLLNKGKTNGVTLKDIQVWLGHSDFSTTANTYSHLDANSKFSSLNTLAGVVNL